MDVGSHCDECHSIMTGGRGVKEKEQRNGKLTYSTSHSPYQYNIWRIEGDRRVPITTRPTSSCGNKSPAGPFICASPDIIQVTCIYDNQEIKKERGKSYTMYGLQVSERDNERRACFHIVEEQECITYCRHIPPSVQRLMNREPQMNADHELTKWQ